MKRIISLLMAILTVITCFALAVPVLAVDEEPTTKWYQYTQEECKHNNMIPGDRYYGPEYYFKNRGECFLCGYVCEHPQSERVYNVDSSASEFYDFEITEKAHIKLYTCQYCCTSDLVDESTKENHKYGKWEYKGLYEDEHVRKCKICEHVQRGKCSYKTTYKKGKDDQYHSVVKTCKTCKQKGYVSPDREKHTFKKNKCTKCGYTRVVPGTVKISTAKNTAAGKKRVVNVEGKWVYQNGEYIWKKPYSYNCYDYKIKLKYSSKNAVKYLVTNSKDKDLNDGRNNRVVTKKKDWTYTYTVGRNRAKKVTLYITPISKTGTYGKTVKKTITLKN